MRYLTPLALLLLAVPARAQTGLPTPEDEAAVEAAVVALFDAMRAADSAAVRAHFHPEARLLSVGQPPEGAPTVTETPIGRFVEAVGGEHPLFDEHIGPVEVRVDGGLATAWMPYAFYYGGAFSHCGVNAFHLVRTEAGWKTIHITDTRRKDACDLDVP